MIRARGLTVRRGATVVVERLEWTIRRGSITWVVGPNGAGKSSLLRVLAGRDRPADGRVERPPGAAPLYFPGEAGLPPTATVGDWERALRGLLPPGAGGRTALWPSDIAAGRRLGRLSTGERKRLLLDALLRRPAAPLLLDEPYEHLSPDGKRALSAVLDARAADAVVVVATNQLTARARIEGGLRLGGGAAEPMEGGA